MAPAVLVCADPPGSALDHEGLLAELTSTLVEAGIAVARFETRRDDPATRDDASSLVDDASAVFRWLLLRDDVDPRRVGVIGVALGSVVAAMLAARTDRVSRLCLLAPATNEDAIGRLDRSNGASPLLDPATLTEPFLASYAKLTPFADIATHERVTLILHGAADQIVPPASGRSYADPLELAGHQVEHELIAFGDHDLSSPELRALGLSRIARFFDEMKSVDATGTAA